MKRKRQRSLKILIVDDDKSWADCLVSTFSRYGFECRSCQDVDAGLDTIESWEPDVIISDFSMPRRTGADLFDEVSRKLPGLVARGGFVFLTGSPDDVRAVVGDERVTILPKPYPPKDLLKMLESLSLGNRVTPAGAY